MDGNVTLTHLMQLVANRAMKGRQPVEGDGWTQVVYGVIGHIPKEKTQQRIRLRGSGVGPDVRSFCATHVLGHAKPAQEGLADESGNQPVNQRR